MRSSLLLTTLSTLALATVSCSSGIQVRTAAAPDATLGGLHTFRVLAPPSRRFDAPALSPDDPMLDNSITNRDLRNDLVQALESKGYASNRESPDFVVAYYAGTKEKMDTTYWNPDPAWRYAYRGYRYGWAWPWYGYAAPIMQVQEYTEGSVVVDVIDPKSRELLWRGQGVARVSDNPTTYGKEIAKTVDAIIKKFPRSSA